MAMIQRLGIDCIREAYNVVKCGNHTEAYGGEETGTLLTGVHAAAHRHIQQQ